MRLIFFYRVIYIENLKIWSEKHNVLETLLLDFIFTRDYMPKLWLIFLASFDIDI
jgi:hypothetical protein